MKIFGISLLAGLAVISGCSTDEQPASSSKFSHVKNNTWYHYNKSDTVFVFVHGIFSESRTCWLYEDRQNPSLDRFWPEMVVEDSRLREPSVYLGGYYTAVDSTTYDASDCAKQLFTSLRNPDSENHDAVLDRDNIIFVCHSTGGIVVRSMLIDNANAFKNKKVGLVLIASPSLGSYYANYLGFLSEHANNQLGLTLRKGDRLLEDLDRRFKDFVYNQTIPNMTGSEFYENHFIVHSKWFSDPKKVVEMFSAARYFDSGVQIPNSNHFTIVKPDSLDAEVHKHLVDFYRNKFLPQKRGPEENERIYQTLEQHLQEMSGIFTSLDVQIVPSSEGKSAYNVQTDFRPEDWAKWEKGIANLRDALKKVNDPISDRQKVLYNASAAAIALRDNRGEVAGRLLLGAPVEEFLEELKKDLKLGTSIIVMRARVAEIQNDWASAISSYKQILGSPGNDDDIWRQLFRCHVLYSHQLSQEEKFDEAFVQGREAENLLLRFGGPNLAVLDFSGEADKQGIPKPWVKLPFTGELKAEIIKESGHEVAFRLTTENSSGSVTRAVAIDPRQTPLISWEWRADELPPDGDLRDDARDDQACQIVLAFMHEGQFLLFNYVWDSNAPVGTTYYRKVTRGIVPYKMLYLVVRSGAEQKGKWVRETRNLEEDLRLVLSKERGANIPPESSIQFRGVGVQANSQHSHSRATGSFRTIRLFPQTVPAPKQ
jgi:hypothetical protein